MSVASLQARLALYALILGLAFGAGFWCKGRLVAASEAKALRQEVKQQAKDIVTATQQSVQIDTAGASDGTRIDTIRQQVARRLQPKEKPHASPDIPPAGRSPEANCPDPVPAVLDLGTVRLLNDAAHGAVQPAGGSDDEKPPAAGPEGRSG